MGEDYKTGGNSILFGFYLVSNTDLAVWPLIDKFQDL